MASALTTPASTATRPETQHLKHPELFPAEMQSGSVLHSSRLSVKRKIVMRRIQLKASGDTYQIRPSFVMPYMVAFTEDAGKGALSETRRRFVRGP
jgi:hypothetical protein